MQQYIYSFEDADSQNKSVGGKAHSLIKMRATGLPVPEGYVIVAEAFCHGELCYGAQCELKKVLMHLSDKCTYAVRSSAINEDGEEASFAGAYETLTKVKVNQIEEAVHKVAASATDKRVSNYAALMGQVKEGVAVVIQRFVPPEFAGVLFTVNPVTGSAAVMQGNYVCGEGEQLVSGNANAKEFSFDTLKYKYHGNRQLKRYARRLYHDARSIQRLYQAPTDIEWAISEGKLYILQARPVTTLKRFDPDTYWINGSLAGEYLMSRTNVGEIFTCPISPITYSALDSVCESMGIPHFIDNIYGQPYANISVICSLLISLGIPRKKAYSMIAEIAGTVPEQITIPVFPFRRRSFLAAMFRIIFQKKKKQYFRMKKHEFADKMGDIADQMIADVRKLRTNEELKEYWKRCDEFMSNVLGAIISSIKTKQLLSTRKKMEKIAGAELANELCEGCAGGAALESMKPLLCLEQVIKGEMTKEEYRKRYGHRCATEMELARPYPYEDPQFPDQLIAEHKRSGLNAEKMHQEHIEKFYRAEALFKTKYPGKAKWLDRRLSEYGRANVTREQIRSRGVKLFCLLREFLLKTGEVNHIGDDVFLLYLNEVLQLIDGNREALAHIALRQDNYKKYQTYPSFPNLICGRFDPDLWLKDEKRRKDIFMAGGIPIDREEIRGYAGATGIVEGRARVITDLAMADQLEKGDILVTTATNIGWTLYFPRASAIITDIGAPLSHAAIVAREFGIPAVVGCQNATTLLHTGDYVRVDGGTGSVEVLSKSDVPDQDTSSVAAR